MVGVGHVLHINTVCLQSKQEGAILLLQLFVGDFYHDYVGKFLGIHSARLLRWYFMANA